MNPSQERRKESSGWAFACAGATVLGIVMLAHGYGGGLPERAAPLATMTNVGYLFRRSRRAIRRDRKRAAHS